MPIEHGTHGGTVITGDSLNYFALCAQRGAVGLELKGIRMSRGPVLWKRLRDHYGIKGKGSRMANKQQVYDWLCAKVEELRPLQEHRTVQNGRIIREVGGEEVQ